MLTHLFSVLIFLFLKHLPLSWANKNHTLIISCSEWKKQNERKMWVWCSIGILSDEWLYGPPVNQSWTLISQSCTLVSFFVHSIWKGYRWILWIFSEKVNLLKIEIASHFGQIWPALSMWVTWYRLNFWFWEIRFETRNALEFLRQ